MYLLQKGNKKLGKNILNFSITPIVTCPNCEQCKHICYGKKALHLYPNVARKWKLNHQISETDFFIDAMKYEIDNLKKQYVIRIHVVGDFYSYEYFLKWKEIVSSYPEHLFYGYSKCFDLYDMNELNQFENCNIINSIAFDGKPNFGDKQRVNFLIKNGYSLCPDLKENSNIICGEDCNICHYHSKVCFMVH